MKKVRLYAGDGPATTKVERPWKLHIGWAPGPAIILAPVGTAAPTVMEKSNLPGIWLTCHFTAGATSKGRRNARNEPGPEQFRPGFPGHEALVNRPVRRHESRDRWPVRLADRGRAGMSTPSIRATARPSVSPRCHGRTTRPAEGAGHACDRSLCRPYRHRNGHGAFGRHKTSRNRSLGKPSKADELAAILEFIRPSDELAVVKLDRLGRSTRDVLNLVHELEQKGAGLHVLEWSSARRLIPAESW
jgi:hypothetical protein